MHYCIAQFIVTIIIATSPTKNKLQQCPVTSCFHVVRASHKCASGESRLRESVTKAEGVLWLQVIMHNESVYYTTQS